MDALEDYVSSEDEDYVPGDEADEHFDQHAAKGKGTKRKRGAAGIELQAPKRVPLTTKAAKKKGVTRIGAAVLSDDDDDLMLPPLYEPSAEDRKEDATQQRVDAQQEERKESEPQTAATDDGGSATGERKEDGSHRAGNNNATRSDTANSSADSHTAAVTPSSTLSSSPSTASTATSTTTTFHSAIQSPPLPPASHTPAAAAAKGGDLASILAQFNKKPITSKPAVKKIINSWELPAKPKPATQLTTPPPAPSTSSDTATTTSAPSAASSSTASPAPPALSTEQVVVRDITSYAGETIEITKTVIRGSAEELAHRAATANNLSTLLSSLTNQRTISTLEKSRLDWSVSKEEEGDADELRRFVGSKEGLVDRMAFLARTEAREWEKVKAVRDESKRQTMTASTEGMGGD